MRTASDRPIEKKAEDTIGRDRLAASFAGRIQEVDSTGHGVVVGVLGPWGSGKTSFVNLVRIHLDDADVTTLDFNPWMFSGTAELVDSFFIELSSQLRLSDRVGDVGQRFAEYGELFSNLGWLPAVGPWLQRAGGLSQLVQGVLERRQEGVAEPRARLETALRSLDAPIVVVLDDIDRLTSAEIRHVFKLIRLIANLPNIVYVVAFDRVRVEQALSETGVPGRDYLEKILQVAVDLPRIPTDVLRQQVFETLDAALDAVDHRPLDVDRWPDVFVEVIEPLISNIRDVTRYANAVHWTAKDIGDAVDIVDVLALEAVRVFMPNVFTLLPSTVEGLTRPASNYIGGTPEPDPLKASVEALIEAGDDHEGVVHALITRVFPAGGRHLGEASYGTDFQKRWRRGRHVAHPDFLRLYLERVAGEEVKAFDAAEQAHQVMHNADALREYLHGLAPDVRENVIAAMEAFEEDYTPEQVVPSVTVLLNLLPHVPERPLGMFDFGPRLTVTRVTFRLLRTLPGPDEVELAVDEALPRIEGLSLQLELLEDVGHRPNRGHKLVAEEFYNQRLRAWRERVRAATADELATEYALGRMLLLAQRDRDDDETPVSVPDDPRVTAALLQSLTSEARSQSMGSRAVRRQLRIAWDVLVEILEGEDEAAGRVAVLDGTELLDDETLALALQYASGWRPDDDFE